MPQERTVIIGCVLVCALGCCWQWEDLDLKACSGHARYSHVSLDVSGHVQQQPSAAEAKAAVMVMYGLDDNREVHADCNR